MLPIIRSLKSGDPSPHEEITTLLLEGARFKAEHIASHGAASPPDFWYDQDLPEWVALLTGTASIGFDDGILHLKAGEYLTIPAHVRHRVAATSSDATWLALHFEPLTDQEAP